MLMLSRAQNILTWGLFIVIISVLLAQAHNPQWRDHLQVDVVVSHQRATSFFEQGSWVGISNEYQPGALWYFVLLGALTPPPIPFDAFLATTIFVNLLLLGVHLYFFQRVGHPYSAFFFLLFVAATGPILLFRFELIVSLFVLLAWQAFGKSRFAASAFLLGLASAVKVYPVVLFPLLAGELLRRRLWLQMIHATLFFFMGVSLPVVAYLASGDSWTELTSSLNFHQLKPVGLEGIWGSTIVSWQQAIGLPLHLTPGYGVHGFTPSLPWLSIQVLNSAWMLPFGLALLGLLWGFRRQGYTDPALPFILLLIFVLFAKVLNPQYLWWFFSLLPLIPLTWFSRGQWGLAAAMSVGSLVLTQIIYPLHYTEFLDWFHQTNPDPTFFYVSIMRNILLVGLLLLFLWRTKAVNGSKSQE